MRGLLVLGTCRCKSTQVVAIIVPGSSTNVVYRADDRNDEHDDMMHRTELFIISVRVGHITTPPF